MINLVGVDFTPSRTAKNKPSLPIYFPMEQPEGIMLQILWHFSGKAFCQNSLARNRSNNPGAEL